MTPQERAEQIATAWFGGPEHEDRNPPKDRRDLTEAIRVAIVEATNAEVERRRDAEYAAEAALIHIKSFGAVVRQQEKTGGSFCSWCGYPSFSREEAREHASTCEAHPSVQRLTAAEKEKDDLKKRLADLRRPTHGPCCTCQRCGKHYDDCRCNLDAVVDDLEIANQRLAARELAIAEAVVHLNRAYGDLSSASNSGVELTASLHAALAALEPKEAPTS